MKNYLIKQDLGAAMAIGVHGDEGFVKMWEVISANYNMRAGGFLRQCEFFAYFLTERQKFIDALALLYKVEFQHRGIVPLGGGRILGLQKARREILSIPSETFYT